MKKKDKRIKNLKPLNLDQEAHISYKNTDFLRQCLSFSDEIIARKRTKLPRKKQKRLVREIKRARFLALLPYTQLLSTEISN
jgi:small subunit ribosomal protein S18